MIGAVLGSGWFVDQHGFTLALDALELFDLLAVHQVRAVSD